MLETFIFFLELGFRHVIDFNGLDHFYYFIVLAVPFNLDKWIRLLKWVTFFTLGHCLTLFINYYFKISVDSYWVEILIPITIVYSCILIILKKEADIDQNIFKYFTPLTFIFGLIHGMGFGRYFNLVVQNDSSLSSLLGFAFGIEFAQLIIVSIVLILNGFIIKNFKNIFKIWVVGFSFLILILSLKMVFERV
tara:strand:+ start:786 stop:1364 length:579 start_codon:yes stop_codon:yes gene_type:complete